MTQKVQGEMLEDGSVLENVTGGATLVDGNYLRVTASGTELQQRTPTEVRTDIGAGTGSGSVTSVGIIGSTGLAVSGSPVVGAGDITLTLDTGLQALASFNTSAFLAQSSTNVFVGRTLTGTASRLSVTNGTGVSGNPVFDIDAAYVGQTSITTLGTITTGTWTGTAIAATRGGTGQTTYAVGDILYASTTSALSKLAGVATGNALISGGVNTAPSWGKIALTTHVSGVLPEANGGTGQAAPSGTYTPTLTGITNVAASTAYAARWIRIGNIVFVTGALDIDPTATGLVEIELTLPVASNFGTTVDLAGVTGAQLDPSRAGGISSVVATDKARLSFTTTTTTNLTSHYSYSYSVI